MKFFQQNYFYSIEMKYMNLTNLSPASSTIFTIRFLEHFSGGPAVVLDKPETTGKMLDINGSEYQLIILLDLDFLCY